jgi:hypothetical protein
MSITIRNATPRLGCSIAPAEHSTRAYAYGVLSSSPAMSGTHAPFPPACALFATKLPVPQSDLEKSVTVETPYCVHVISAYSEAVTVELEFAPRVVRWTDLHESTGRSRNSPEG